MVIASIDIGTNTCNISVANTAENKIVNILHREKRPIKLIDNRFHNNKISKLAIKRCTDALLAYKKLFAKYNVDQCVAVATSGIRSAANSKDIIDEITAKTNIKIEIIDGLREALLAYEGVKNAVNIGDENVLIVDIGGGSVEFIVCNSENVIWKKSYQIGIARLLRTNDFSDPLNNSNINFLYNFFEKELIEVQEIVKSQNVCKLIGSSGSFDTLKNLIICSFTENIPDNHKKYFDIDIQSFKEIHKQLISLNLYERIEMKGMDPIRVEMMPLASVLTNFMIEKFKIREFIQSGYSLKEGLIFDYLKNNNK